MLNPFNFFDNIYYINLDSRSDRKELCEKELLNMGLDSSWINRIPGRVVSMFKNKKQDACFGNHLSHADCFYDAAMNDYFSILIFEDDVEFFYDRDTTWEFLSKAIEQLPKDWDMFYFGINLDRWNATQVSKNLARLHGGFSTHAYAVKYTLFSKLNNINRDATILHNDVYYAENIHPNYNCYVTIPLLCGQRFSYSNIEDKEMESNQMFLDRFEKGLIRL